MSIFIHGDLMAQIKRDLACVQNYVRLNVATGYTDSNKDAENFYCGLLNAAFGWKLKNLNALQMDFPAIDLGDAESGICVQVTSTEGREKVNKTLKKFFAHKLHTEGGYQRLIVLIIGEKPTYRDPFVTEDGFDFDANRDIWDTKKLIQEIEGKNLTTVKAVAEYLAEHLNVPRIAAPLLHLPLPGAMAKAEFLGRQAELAELAGKLEEDDAPIYLSGLGGMGKTALVTRFCAGYRGGNVYFVRFRESFTQTVAMEVAAGIPGYKDRQADPDRDYAEAMALLGQCGKGDILIIDNVDGPNDDLGALQTDHTWAQLRKMKLRLILTTRCDQSGAVQVRKMANETLHRFFENQGLSLEKAQMDALIDAVHGHTMTVDLMARTLRRSRTLTVEKLLEVLGGGGLKDPKFRPVALTRNGKVTQEVIYEHLRRLFNVAKVSEEARVVLRNMVLLPESGMDLEILEVVLPSFKRGVLKRIKSMFSGEKSKTPGVVINDLIDHGWLAFDGDTRFVTIHPVVRLVCREELKPDDKNCGAFLWAVWNQYDRKQYSAEKFKQFGSLFSQAAEILPDEEGDWAINAGVFWHALGQSGNALRHGESAVRHLEKSQPDSRKLATACNNLGATYGALGDHKKALEYQLKALEILKKVLPRSHPDLATPYNNVGSTYGELGDHKKALAFKLKALEICERVLPQSHPNLAASYNNVGHTYGDLGDHKKELEYQVKALEILKKVLPPSHPDLATFYNNVGGTYGELGDNKKALEYQLKALEIREKSLPPAHPLIAASCYNLMIEYYRQGDYETALRYGQRAVSIAEQSLPEGHSNRERYKRNLEALKTYL